MVAAFTPYAGALPVESGATTESLADVLAVMRTGGAVLGFLDGQPRGSARFRIEPDELYVGRVSVLPTHRRRGLASAMMAFLASVAADRGLGAVRVQVRDSLPGNVALYESLGYERVSIHPHPRGPDRVWTMRRPLRGESAQRP